MKVKKRTPGALKRERQSKARGGVHKGGSVCVFCKEPIPDAETARTFATPVEHQPLPPGSAWVVCGEFCKELPAGAVVFYRTIKEAKGRR